MTSKQYYIRHHVLPNLEKFARNLAFILYREEFFKNINYNKRETQLRMIDVILGRVNESHYSEEEMSIMVEALTMTIEQLNAIFEEKRESRKHPKLLKLV